MYSRQTVKHWGKEKDVWALPYWDVCALSQHSCGRWWDSSALGTWPGCRELKESFAYGFFFSNFSDTGILISIFTKLFSKRLRWPRGSVLTFGTQVRGFKPGRSRRNFQGEKIFSTPSFGGEVKPSVPCRRFTACKRFLNATWKSGISGKIHRPFLAHIVPPLATRISGKTTSGESWNV